MLKLEDNYLHKGKRRELIKTLRHKGISDEAVLEAINSVPRHFFFDSALLSHAYEDKAFPIGEGQTISQPYTVAFQSQLLDIVPGEKVLEIGTGSGYQAGILYCLGAEVHTIEFNKVLYERTKRFLPKIGVMVKHYLGDGSLGIAEQAPFDKIIVTAGAPVVPNTLLQQLNINGVMVIPVGNREKQQMLKLTKQTNKKILKETFDYFSFVPLLGDEGW
jgi:protein-L-isoaspartate(D-aspartate) O-methyltransferase